MLGVFRASLQMPSRPSRVPIGGAELGTGVAIGWIWCWIFILALLLMNNIPTTKASVVEYFFGNMRQSRF